MQTKTKVILGAAAVGGVGLVYLAKKAAAGVTAAAHAVDPMNPNNVINQQANSWWTDATGIHMSFGSWLSSKLHPAQPMNPPKASATGSHGGASGSWSGMDGAGNG